MTTADAINQATVQLAAADVDAPRIDARLLLAFVLQCRREDLAREPERLLTPREVDAFESAVDRRARREPLPYITGVQEFFGRPFVVDPGVLIPRPETELLVELTLKRLADVDKPRIVEAGVGSGCIAVTLAAERPDATVVGTDISVDALLIAAANAKALGVDDRTLFIEGSLLTPIVGDVRFHAVVSNPPYVTEAELAALQPEVRDYEPRLALSGKDGASGDMGTALYPQIFQQAFPILESGGWVLVEIGMGQSDVVMEAAVAAGFVDVEAVDDFAGIPRVVTGRKYAA